MLMKA